MSFFLQLATAIPDTEVLKSGDERAILVWIILGLIALFTVLLTRHLMREKYWEGQRVEWDTWKEKAHGKMMKLALRVQKGVEAWVGIQADMTEEEDEE